MYRVMSNVVIVKAVIVNKMFYKKSVLFTHKEISLLWKKHSRSNLQIRD